jgi:predicted Zn-dependent peptidase
MRVESSPQGKLREDFLTTAFAAHPYHNPTGGWPSDLASLRSSAAKAFFEKYYVPANVTMAIVGDVNPVDAKRMAERYFGPWQARPLPPVIHTKEPPQPGPKVAVVESASQPIELVGFKRPDQYDKDDAVFDVIQLILSQGRTGLLYKDLVRDKKIAIAAQAIGNFPASRYPNLFTFVLVPALGHTVEENQKALEDLLVRFTAQPADPTALARAKTQARAGVIRRLANNAGLASLLATYAVNYGDWKKLFTAIDDLNKVTAADVQRVSLHCFVTGSRTIAYTVPPRGGRQ